MLGLSLEERLFYYASMLTAVEERNRLFSDKKEGG